ncbi:MAG: IS630 family transposase [Alteromonadales bacterium]|nr:IS630 family transposase [Alteromonadales bacterium]
MAGSPDPLEYACKLKELADLFALEDSSYLNIYFADESGFSLTPSIPYGWQEIGVTESIPSAKSQQVNIFGLLSRDNDCHSYYNTGSITSKATIAYIDDFAKQIKGRTVIIMDNAPIHKSNIFTEKISEWAEQDLLIFFLPTYSPHLNIIEILWRKMKYEWLKPKDYGTLENLTKALNNILVNIGEQFTINFSEPEMSIISA